MSSKQSVFEFPSNPAYQLENFIVCDENKFAYQATSTIVDYPDSEDLNPLIIVGGEGTGKTHLLHAAANRIGTKYPEKKVTMVSTSDLINKYREEKSFPETNRLSKKYNEFDFLLVDDIHLLEEKHHLQEQIFHTYNDLISNGKRVVFSSRRSPANMNNLNSYLRSRLLSGALITIKSSEDHIRLSILQKIAKDKYFKLSEASAKFIIYHYTRDIKEFEKIIQKIGVYSLKLNKRVTPFLIKEFINEMRCTEK